MTRLVRFLTRIDHPLKCPLCGYEAMKVIYMGFPMKLCMNEEECNCLWGMWSWVLRVFPVAVEDEFADEPYFRFQGYRGSYLRALWTFLTCAHECE